MPQVASLSISFLNISLHLVTNLLPLHHLVILGLLLSVVTSVGFGHSIMLLKVLLQGISNLLLNFRFLISSHSLCVLHQSILVISGLGLHINSIQSIAQNTRLNSAQLKQGFSIVEVSLGTLRSHLTLLLGHDLASLGAVRNCIRNGMHQKITFALSQQLLGMLKAFRSDNHS